MLKSSQTRVLKVKTNRQVSSDTWHARLGHLPLPKLKDAVKCSVGINLTADDSEGEEVCEGCALGKLSCNSFPKGSSGTIKTSKPLELVHSDVMGPMKTKSMGGAKYVLTFIDDYSRHVRVYFLGS
jgi:hypothetical protein